MIQEINNKTVSLNEVDVDEIIEDINKLNDKNRRFIISSILSKKINTDDEDLLSYFSFIKEFVKKIEDVESFSTYIILLYRDIVKLLASKVGILKVTASTPSFSNLFKIIDHCSGDQPGHFMSYERRIIIFLKPIIRCGMELRQLIFNSKILKQEFLKYGIEASKDYFKNTKPAIHKIAVNLLSNNMEFFRQEFKKHFEDTDISAKAFNFYIFLFHVFKDEFGFGDNGLFNYISKSLNEFCEESEDKEKLECIKFFILGNMNSAPKEDLIFIYAISTKYLSEYNVNRLK